MAGYYKKNTKKVTKAHFEIEQGDKHNRIDFHFGSIPPVEIREYLKANGWKYYKPNKCWFNYDSAENRELAQNICDALEEMCNTIKFGKKTVAYESDYNDANVTSFPKRIVEAIRDNYESLDNGWIL